MLAKNWVVGVVAICIGSPFAVGALGMIGVGTGFNIEVPEWEAGYEWRYDSVIDMSLAFNMMGMSETESLEILGETQRVVANTTLDFDSVPVYAVAEQYRPTRVTVDGETVFDAATSPDAQSGFEWAGCVVMCAGEYGFYTQEHLNPYYPGHDVYDSFELRLLDFPLKRKAWTVMEWDESGWELDDVQLVLEANAVGMGFVRLPGLGALEAVQIEASLTKESVDAMKRAMRLDAMEEMPGVSVHLDLDYGITYWYAPEAKQIVRMDSAHSIDLRATYEGETFEMRQAVRTTETLKSFSLQAGPERSLAEIQRINRLLDELPEVRDLSEKVWPFAVAANRFSVDASKGGTITLGILSGQGGGEIIADSYDAIPDGMSVEWRHRYLETQFDDDGEPVRTQAKVDRYSAETLELPINVQGLHEVTAYLLDKEGKLVGADTVILEGRGVWTYESDLPLGLPGFSGRHDIDMETSPFLKEVYFLVDPGPLGQGNAEWARDNVVEGFPVNGRTEKTYPNDSPEYWGTSEFTYRDQVRVDPLKMYVEARYDRSADPSPYLRNAKSAQDQAALPGVPGFFAGAFQGVDRCAGLAQPCGFLAGAPKIPEIADRFGLQLGS